MDHARSPRRSIGVNNTGQDEFQLLYTQGPLLEFTSYMDGVIRIPFPLELIYSGFQRARSAAPICISAYFCLFWRCCMMCVFQMLHDVRLSGVA